jgi:hypothetical protein
MLPELNELSTLDFKPISTCPLAIGRIVVDLQGRHNITNKSMTQVLHRDDRHAPWLIPRHMMEETVRGSSTVTEGFSQIWNSCPYSTFGDPISAKPVLTTSFANMPVVPAPQKFVTASQAHDISKWTEDIAAGIDPEAIEVEAPFEIVPAPGRQRVMREDSDDEEEESEEEQPEAPPLPATKRVPILDSDDEVEEIVLSVPATQRNAVGNTGTDLLPTGEEVTASRLRGGAPHSDDGHEDVSSRIAAEHQPQEMPQPTWTSNPFSVLTEEEEQGAPSEPQSTILAMPPTSPRVSPSRSPHLSPTQSSHQSSQSSVPQSLHQTAQQSPDLLDAQSSIAETYEETGAFKTPMSPPKLPNRDEFDPQKYGGARRGGYSARGRESSARNMAPPARGGGRGRPHSVRGASSFWGRGTGGKQPNYSHPDLVQLSVAPFAISTEKIRPPPGLDIRGNGAQSTSCSTNIDLLDGPLDDLQVPSMKPVPVDCEHSQEPLSASNKRSSNLSSANSGASYVNLHNPPRDLAKIENNQLAKLYEIQKEAREKKRLDKEVAEKLQAESQAPSQPWSQPTASRNSTQRRQKEDENSSRRVHNTMRQQAPKPGKKGKQSNPKLTEKERKQRLDDVLGEVSTRIVPATATFTEPMSARKKQALKKNPEIDPVAAAQLSANRLSSRQTASLIQCLNPLFAASRGFPGQLKFEIQLGQVLIANSSKDLVNEEIQLFTIKNWESVFSPSKQQPIATTFTNILTRNGHDVDRLLKMNPPRGLDGCGPEKLFDELKPGPSEISYEFHCQSKESEEFWIIVDSSGNYSIRKSMSTIGTVNLHYPASIWDARAILHGTAEFCEPEEEISFIVETFMRSVYVPAQASVSITYRQPAENDMTVRSVTVKRISLHNCHIMDRQDIQLQIVEVKDLFHRFHTRDKKLTQAFEKGYPEMHEQDRIHYEVSLVHNNINEMLKQNRTLKTGDLASGVSGKELLKPQAIQDILDIVSHMVSKIDWAGINNNGTFLRIMQEEHDLSARIATTIPGTRPAPSFAGMTSTAAGGAAAIRSEVPGIRINTKAEIGCDADGKPVLIGMGGAMIPIPATEDEFNVAATELAPNDSASNIGVGPQTYVPSAAFARRPAARGPNFW